MTALVLTPAARKAHRASAHHLQPVVHVGADGFSDAVRAEADRALAAHGLIKIRVFADDRAERESLLAEIADRLDAAPVQHIGKLLVLWRPRADAPPPAPEPGRRAAPRVVKVVKAAKSPTHRPQVKRVTLLGNQRLTAGGLVKKARPKVRSAKKSGG